MRDYAKVSPQFWIGKTGKELKRKGHEAVIVAMHLLTSSHANMLGLYHVPVIYIAHDTGLPLEGASKGLRWCIEAGFCAYDEEAEMVWVYEMASYQIAPTLKKDDKRCAGIQNEYDALPECQHLCGFHEKYALAFHMTKSRGLPSPIEAPSKPLRSQEQEQEQEQEKEQDKKHVEQNPLDPSAGNQVATVSANQPNEVKVIFEYWQKIMNSPKSVLDDKRRSAIAKALKLYSPADICKAIRGCSKSPFNMGDNDRKTKYNGLQLILRDAEHIDHFIALDQNSAKPAKESIDQMNDRIAAEFLQDQSLDDGNTIEMETT